MDWFFVHFISDSGEAPLEPNIYVPEFETFEPAQSFTFPTTRWFGPFHIPSEESVP